MLILQNVTNNMKNQSGLISILLLLPILSLGAIPAHGEQVAIQDCSSSVKTQNVSDPDTTSAEATTPLVSADDKISKNTGLDCTETKEALQEQLPQPQPGEQEQPADQRLRISYEESPDDRPILRDTQVPFANQVDSLSAEILGLEIELLKLNTNLRVKSTDKNRIKPWRTFLYNLGGSGVATAGITTIAAERWRTWRRPAAASRTALKAGPIMLLTSHSIITGGILLESALDLANDHRIKKAGLDTKSTKKKAIDLVRQIDNKLKERETLLAGLTSLSQQDRSRAVDETPVLKDLRNMAVSEYCNFHTRAKKRLAARNFAYINGFVSATTGGYLGSLCGLLAVSCRKPRLVGPAGVGFTISGASIALGPEMGRLVANCVGSFDKKLMKRTFGVIPKAQMAEHLTTLREHSMAGATPLAQRISIYDSASAVLKKQAEINAAEKKRADREFVERCLFNAAIGGSKMAWGIQLMNAGYGFNTEVARQQARPAARTPANPLSKYFPAPRPRKTQAQLFGQRVAQGATSYIPGTSLWIFDTLQSRTRGEMDLYTMGQQGALPHQKLTDRMNKLKDMETKLKQIPQ
ncbi:MAG: hypothetical protein IT343_19705 [Candidatus Melainabacteria bacterium]|jgi:hypothetical protein|nr:hypothetical protein [Candidatus Melainabacteria bacterium]